MLSASNIDKAVQYIVGAVIERGIEAAERDYADKPRQLAGAKDGFESCRAMGIAELRAHRAKAFEQVAGAARDTMEGKLTNEDYWYFAAYAAEVDWVCNCASAWLFLAGRSDLEIVPVTQRALQNVLTIRGGA